MLVLLVMDSRGKGLQKRFDIAAPGVMSVVIKNGGDIPTLLKIANRVAVREKGKYNTIIIAGGICSITKLNRKRQAKLRFQTTKSLIEYVSERIKISLQLLRGDNPKAKVIVSPTIGIELETYNGTPAPRKTQRKLNRMVTAMNKMLIDNNEPGSRVPWISKLVHACKGRGKWSHKYKFLNDGCHFGPKLKDFVVKEINKCLLRM